MVLGNLKSTQGIHHFYKGNPDFISNSSIADNDINRLDSLLSCHIGNENRCDQNFQHILTNKGLCNVYNGIAIENIYHSSQHVDLLSQYFSFAGSSIPFNTQSFGPEGDLNLILDTHQNEVFGSESGSFTMTFNEARKGFDGIANNVELLPGHKTDIYIALTSFETMPDIRADYSVDKRACRFSDELEDKNSIFRSYSKESCRYKCYCFNIAMAWLLATPGFIAPFPVPHAT